MCNLWNGNEIVIPCIEPSIIDLKTFNTDEENNIVDGFIQEFSSAVNIQCFRHFK